MRKLLEVLHWDIDERPDIVVAFSTRRGGVSALPVAGLNLGLHVGDDHRLVLRNRSRLFSTLGLALEDLVLGQQVHGTGVEVVEARHAGRGAWPSKEALPEVDALVTNTPGLVLAGCYADCVPVFIIDPIKLVVALVHAGWKGTADHIALGAWRTMRDRFQSNSHDCMAFIGPCVGRCCYQVDEAVHRVMHSHWWWNEAHQAEARGWRVDLGLANQLQLEDAGLRVHNPGLCTSCDTRFYSYRRDGCHTGRMLGLVSIRPAAGNGHVPRE